MKVYVASKTYNDYDVSTDVIAIIIAPELLYAQQEFMLRYPITKPRYHYVLQNDCLLMQGAMPDDYYIINFDECPVYRTEG